MNNTTLASSGRGRLVATIGIACAVAIFLAMVASMYLPAWKPTATI